MTSRIQYNSPDTSGSFGLPYHYEMVADSSRVHPFREALEHVSKGTIVLESGTGSGILSLIAAKAGAERVYTFEIDPKIGALAIANFQRSGFANIVFGQKDVLDVTLADLGGRRPGVVVAENLSTWQVTEPEIEVLNHINKHLATAETVRIPTRIFNSVELAESQYRFEDLITIRTHYFQFSGIQRPTILSPRALFEEIDLRRINRTSLEKAIEVEVVHSGILNCLRLTSPLEVYRHITFGGSDSLMPPVVVPLREDLPVRRGDRVRIEIAYETCTNWEQFGCSAGKIT